MALDQALLETADRRGEITLRFYRWSEPTLSLGYFQKYADREIHTASRDCPVVRRSSGGGAIVHDHELTYSICVPASNRWSKSSDRLYDVVHNQIIQILGRQGILAGSFGDENGLLQSRDANALPESQKPFDNQSFLCFQRRSPGDIVLKGSKVCGSAQRRLRNALIQHGSLILKTSACAPELEGLTELAHQSLTVNQICRDLSDGIAAELELELTPDNPTNLELTAAEQIECERFRSDAWTRKR